MVELHSSPFTALNIQDIQIQNFLPDLVPGYQVPPFFLSFQGQGTQKARSAPHNLNSTLHFFVTF